MMVFDGSFPVNDRWFWRLLVSYSASPRGISRFLIPTPTGYLTLFRL